MFPPLDRYVYRSGAALVALIVVAAWTSPAMGKEPRPKPTVGVEERLGEMLPLDDLTFRDEEGKDIALASLFDRPVVLSLIYYRCPGICSPLIAEIARLAQRVNLEPGQDFRMVSISFDPDEDVKLAALKRKNTVESMTKRPIGLDDWRFFTGDQENIERLTEAVGFEYQKDKNGVDYIHAPVVTFVSSDGMIARYLHGRTFNPADFELAVVDATEGRSRSFMRTLQRLCYSYEPDSHAYVLKVNRIIFGATLIMVLGFVVFLVMLKRSVPPGGHRRAQQMGRPTREVSE